MTESQVGKRLTGHEIFRGSKDQFDAAVAAGLIVPPMVCDVAYHHDDWCSKLTGGVCACDVEIVVREWREIA